MSMRWDVLIVGAGPAGMAAAVAASRGRLRVAVLDDNAAAGGQIWRRGLGETAEPAKQKMLHAFKECGAVLLAGRRVVQAPEPGVLEAWCDETNVLERYHYDRLILATGARERFLPFPGWTLPGVMGAGGLQALVRGGYDVRGKRVVVAGTGPLLMAVAAHLKHDGAKVVAICEQASMARMLPFAAQLAKKPSKILQAVALGANLRGVSYKTGCWPVAAIGNGRLQHVELTDGRRRWTEQCDLLACGFHLVPNLELPLLFGCRVENDAVAVNAMQQTSVAGVYCAGEPTGIAGVDAALLQGEIAGLAAAGNTGGAEKLVARSKAERAFGEAMTSAFRLRDEVLRLCDANTIVCRCEDVSYGSLKALADEKNNWTDAKLLTRCGMGPCQGRVCGPAVEALFGWKNASVRPPVFPVPIAAFITEPQSEFDNQQALQEMQ
ncbi:FAD/NAD(P)-dependent oxidoreductase [Silvibacterium acidisoli]|uniref:FAD/NAD(P)-dependent oxidoreductase n=1 Tax=Acidobacteriaceae bacterium ZG23-2 TaxID=2883246 RepID=UPI00406CD05E